MSIKSLFTNNKSNQIQKTQTIESASAEVEGVNLVKAKTHQKNEFIPPIDFSTASNFAKFGSAELYYEYSFERIYNEYPYDGTLAEKIQFENSSSYLDKYIFENLYPSQLDAKSRTQGPLYTLPPSCNVAPRPGG